MVAVERGTDGGHHAPYRPEESSMSTDREAAPPPVTHLAAHVLRTWELAWALNGRRSAVRGLGDRGGTCQECGGYWADRKGIKVGWYFEPGARYSWEVVFAAVDQHAAARPQLATEVVRLADSHHRMRFIPYLGATDVDHELWWKYVGDPYYSCTSRILGAQLDASDAFWASLPESGQLNLLDLLAGAA